MMTRDAKNEIKNDRSFVRCRDKTSQSANLKKHFFS